MSRSPEGHMHKGPRVIKSIETERRMEVPGAGVKKGILEVGCTAMSVYLLNCTFSNS